MKRFTEIPCDISSWAKLNLHSIIFQLYIQKRFVPSSLPIADNFSLKKCASASSNLGGILSILYVMAGFMMHKNKICHIAPKIQLKV